MAPRIIIAGSTGHLGSHITSAVIAQRESFSQITLLLRRKTPQTDAWEQTGASVLLLDDVDDDLTSKLDGHDVLINCLPSTADNVRQAIARALPSTSIQLYFPSEFGVDHYIHDFSHPEWAKKKAHLKLVQGGLQKQKEGKTSVKVCRVYAGLFLEDSIGPWFGFNTKDGEYEVVGSADQRVSYTSLDDVGKAVAALALRPSESWQDLPDQIHLSGDCVSAREIASVMGKESGQDISIKEIDLADFRAATLQEPGADPSKCLRFLMGEGKIGHSEGEGRMGNMNEVVNPGEKGWRWKTMGDLARKEKGRPWADWKA